jgi:Uncharacterized protein conserved in bacteria
MQTRNVRLALAVVAMGWAGAVAARAASADEAFEKLAAECIENLLQARPEMATQLGDHRFDDRLTDFGAAALAERERTLRAQLAALEQIDVEQLTGPNRVDAEILRLELGSMLFVLTEEKPHEWNPLSYNDSLATSIYLLTAREFAPAEERLRNAAKRLNEIPRVVEQIKATLRNPPRIHTETAIGQTAGAIGLVQNELEPLLLQAPKLRAELKPAQERAVAALEDYKAWLEREVLPRANGEFRLGAEKFRKKLRFALDSEMSPEEIVRRAEAELEATTDEMYVTARPLFRRYFPEAGAEAENDRPRVIKAVLDRLAENRANDETVVERVKEITDAATAFVREKDLMTLPDSPLRIIVLPEFQRGVAIAYCDSPGALEPEGETYYAVAPTPADWSAERKVSFFREYNDYMLHDLSVHEAMPGHFLQIAHSNRFRAPTLVRAVFMSGTFVEGWAVYAERVMAEAGFGGPEVRMQQLKMRVRAIINAILDYKVHCAGMTEQEALDLMMKRGFQEEGEAVGKWRRACQSSTQLSTYFVGAVEHDDARAAAEEREEAAFDLKRYHDRVLSRGSPAMKHVRRELGW